MRAWSRALALLLPLVLAPLAAAAPYPSHSIRWVVPYTPGGITDTVTRLVASKLQDALGQPIVVENKPGANSIVGAEIVAKSAPDGYTILTVIAAHAANTTLYAGKLPFDPVKGFSPISLAAIAPLIITCRPDFPVKDVKELVAYAKANPGKVSFGTSGVGSASHLTMELFKQTTESNLVHIPYKGTAPALQGLLAGDIQVMVDVPSSMMPHVRAGKIRAIGLLSSKRSAGAPEVRTFEEAGGPGIEGSTWLMVLAPAGTPREAIARLSTEVTKAMSAPDLRARFEQLGIEPMVTTPEQTGKFLDDEIAKWAKVITTAGVKPEQ